MVIGSAVIYGISPAMMKVTFAYGGSGLLSTLYTSLFSLPFLFLWARFSHRSLRLDKKTFGRMALLSLGTWPTSLLLYSSYSFIPVGMSTTLHFVYPVAAALYLTVFFRERFGPLNILSLILVVGGMVCIGAASLTGGSLIGMLLAFGSGLTWGFYIVYLEKSGLGKLPACVLNFYMASANALFAAIACLIADGHIGLYTYMPIWLLVIVNAVFHRVAGNGLFQIGIRQTDAFSASIFSTFEPVVSVLLGVLLLGERFSFSQMAGLVLILGGILCNVLAGRRPKAQLSSSST